jgi:hypothetical protein
MAIRRVTGTVNYNPTSDTNIIRSPNNDVIVEASTFSVKNVATNNTLFVSATGTLGSSVIFVQPGSTTTVAGIISNVSAGFAYSVSGGGVTTGTRILSINSSTYTITLTATNFRSFLTPEVVTIIDSGSGEVSTSPNSLRITNNAANVGNITGKQFDSTNIYDTTENRQKGSVYIAGGLGVEKDLNVGGFIYGRISEAITSTQLVVTPTNIDATFYPTFVENFEIGNTLFGDNTGTFSGLTYNPARGLLSTEQISVTSSTVSTSTTTGALTVKGGVGIEGNLTVDDIYTKVLSSLGSKIQIRPEEPLTEIYGDIRVLNGTNPIGTAPVVTNILYVTMDGDDTNDGRAMDPSRACRTITGAVASPFYQSGTQIRVAPGFYLEDNPIRLKPYTSVMGSDIRTTSVEPINKTQDLFHLDSGCYLAFMQFLNGRSGLLEGIYAPNANRGAYATAFPPLEGDERIDLFHSPYVQNCTNLSGPWLRDGTLFTPNQTVQVPLAVGTGTWAAYTTTIVVNASTGTIELGMTINAGQQNPGFFNARTLMLANKPFMQEQVVAYINQEITTNVANTTSIWYGFTYSQEKCYRDVGILVENVAYDAAFGGNQKARESGLAYYNGVISLIAGQEQQTSAAINYLNTLTQQVIINTTCTDLLAGAGEYDQVINTVLINGNVASSSIDSLFGIITTIINNGPDAAPDLYTSTGPDAAYVSAEILMQANRAFIQEDTINYINQQVKEFPYGKAKCRRDVGLIIDSIANDMLYPTPEFSQSNFSGLQYWNQDAYSGLIGQQSTTTAAISYLKELSRKAILHVTEADDEIIGVTRYQTGTTQVTTIQPGTISEVDVVNDLFDKIITIIEGNSSGWTDRIIASGIASNFLSVQQSYDLLQVNKDYFKEEVIAYIDAENPGFSYSSSTYKTDIGYIIDSVSFDLLYGGNRQSVQFGLSYIFTATSSTIQSQETQTVDAFNYLSTLISDVVQNTTATSLQTIVRQKFNYPAATISEANILTQAINTVTAIISGGPTVASPLVPISTSSSNNIDIINAWYNIYDNKEFLKEQVIAYIDQTYNPNSFQYNEEKCYRDIGLIVDAVSQDILLGGNQKSVEAGLSYWNLGFNYVEGQVTTTTMAINYAKDLALDIIANTPVTPQTQTNAVQVINTFFQYGGDYMPQQSVSRNFGIITNIIENGPIYAPPVYAGGGVFALTGINGLDVKIAPTITSVNTITTGTYLLGLSTSTIGFGNNATLYFGNTAVYPALDNEVDKLSLELTGSTSTWHQRKVDPIGSMGGSLVDGKVISSRSPIQSFVYDAYTQLTQGGRGIHITNDGYAQLVSVFTIFSSVGVQTDNGGIASIVNSNANFGDICLLSKGYGKRKFSGTIFNPSYRAYPRSPGPEGFDQYFPFGYWPNGGRVEIFCPNLDNRPSISLVMEVEPPDNYFDANGNTIPFVNEQGFPGFLNASPNKATLSTGTIIITDIDTDGVYVGNSVYIRDQNNSLTGPGGNLYADTGTVVTDVGYRSITLNKALADGGSDPTFGEANTEWFTLYFCGNSYYSVLSSTIADNPTETGTNVLSVSTLTGITVSQVAAHIDAIQHLNTIVGQVINNQTVTPAAGTTETQVIDLLISGGTNAQSFIDIRFNEMTNIIGAANITAAEAVVPAKFRSSSGTIPSGAGSAIILLERNIDFITDEVSNYVINTNLGGVVGTYNIEKCKRDIALILTRLIYDLETGGNLNSVLVGLSYWSRNGSHHIVQLGENVRRNDLFPDGAVVNFYQRSYMSASGYVFEYVGAGTNYGSLPQVGRADPVQGREVVQLNSGKVFFTSTDQNGDFRIGPGLVISQATGVLSGRTFTKSLFANMTPFILAIESGGA